MDIESSFRGKTCLVTGGASGMGLLCGQNFARCGANVVLVDVNAEVLEKCCADIRAEGGSCIGVPTDVRDYAQVTAARDKAVETFGSVDILVNCAGGAAPRVHGVSGKFHEIPIEVFDWGIDVNLKGAFYFCHSIMAQMAKQNSGVIVNLGSITGQEGSGSCVEYAASKSALMNGMVKSLAQAGAPYNVRSVCVAPGPVLTRPGMANMKTLAGRAAEPQEIVDLILFLVSDKAAFINGITVLADGGRNVMFNKT